MSSHVSTVWLLAEANVDVTLPLNRTNMIQAALRIPLYNYIQLIKGVQIM